MSGPVSCVKRARSTEAYRYTGDNTDAIVAWAKGHAYPAEGQLVIQTDRGDAVAEPGDWIIRGLVGEHYPCTPAAFEAGWRTF